MTKKEEIKRMLPILQAFVDGKEIEVKTKEGSRWSKFNEDDFEYLNLTKCDFRIKQEPTYRPFKDAEECWQEMQKHQPFGWVELNETSHIDVKFVAITKVREDGVETEEARYDFDKTHDTFTFADGEPFGVEEERE